MRAACRRWTVITCVLIAVVALCGPLSAERVTTSFNADTVAYSYDRKRVTLTGNASLVSQVADDPSRFVHIEADVMEGDISRGRFEMVGAVRIETPRGTMEGESALYNVRTARFSLRRGGVMVPMNEEGEPEVCGFAYAQDAVREGDVVYITNGRFTTCSKPHPHYAIKADRFRWDTETREVVAYGGSLRVYGLEIPMLPEIPYSFSDEEGNMPSLMPFPTYSGRDGLRLGWSFIVGNPMDYPRSRIRVRWRQLRPLHVFSRTLFHAGENRKFRVNLALREDVRQDIDHVVPIDRYPEFGFEDTRQFGDCLLETDISAGHYRQHDDDDLPEVREDRVRVETRLSGNSEGYLEPGETWWWLEGSESLYGDGSHYATLGGGVGAATRLTDWAAGNLELRRWVTDGESPFAWDDVDVKTELNSHLQFTLTDSWRVRVNGRYDLDGGILRAWEAQLRRREHCLTWTVSYSDIDNDFLIGAEINGLFGNDEPPENPCPDDGPADYWKTHDTGSPTEEASADDQSQQPTTADQASEAMDTP